LRPRQHGVAFARQVTLFGAPPGFYRVRAVIGRNFGPWSHRWVKHASPEPTIVPLVVESAHPYASNLSGERIVTWPNAKRLRAHFLRIETLAGDSLRFPVDDYDEQRTVSYSGSFPNGFWTQWARGSLAIEVRTDATGTAYGHRSDQIEIVADIPDAPDAPTLNEIVPGRISINFNYTPGATASNVYRSTAANGGYVKRATFPIDEHNFDDTQVTAGRAFYHRISCSNDLGESPQSSFLRVVAQ
jgi:hypothetical protein